MTEPETHRELIGPGFLEEPEGAPTPLPSEGGPPPGEPMPPGRALADVLVKGLGARGWALEHRWTTYVGHALEARRGEHRYDVEVALLDTPESEGAGRWLITAKRRTGFFKRIFKDDAAVDEHATLRADIDSVLLADGRGGATRGHWVDEAHWPH